MMILKVKKKRCARAIYLFVSHQDEWQVSAVDLRFEISLAGCLHASEIRVQLGAPAWTA